MPSFFSRIFRRQAKGPKIASCSFSGRRNMGSTTAAVLYAITVSTTSPISPGPEDAKEKSHHLKAGGFRNPWE